MPFRTDPKEALKIPKPGIDLVKDRLKRRTCIPALPFCHFKIKAEKPKPEDYPASIKTLGDRLRARRLDLGLHQKDVAGIIVVTTDTVCYWENGRTSQAF